MKSLIVTGAIFAIPAFESLRAQSANATPTSQQGSSDESHQSPPAWATGVSMGAMHFNGGRSQTSVAATLQYSPDPWLSFSATPGFGHTSLGRTSSTGLSDLPISAGVSHSVAALPLSPVVAASIGSTVSFRDTTSALGAGTTGFAASAALSAWATDQLNLAIAGSHPLRTSAGNGSIDLEAAYSLGKATPNIGFTSEVGRADSGAALARSVVAGVAIAVDGPLTLTIDGGHGISTGAPAWSFSVGFGSAFAGLSPLDPSSPLRRLKAVLGSKVGATSGYTKTGTGSQSCKLTKTC